MANTAPSSSGMSKLNIVSSGLDGLMRGLGIKAHLSNSFIPGMIGSNNNPRTASPSENRDESPLDKVYVDGVGREDTATYRDAVRVVKDSERLAATDQVEAIRRLDTGFLKFATYVQGEFGKFRTTFKEHASSINTLSDQNLQLQRRQRALDDQIKFLSNQGRGPEKKEPGRIETSRPVTASSGFSLTDLAGAATGAAIGASILAVLKRASRGGILAMAYAAFVWLKQKKGQEELRTELKKEGWADEEIDLFYAMSDEDKLAYFDKRTNNRFPALKKEDDYVRKNSAWKIPDEPSAQSMDRKTFDQWYQKSLTGVAPGFGGSNRFASRLGNSFTSAAGQLGANQFGDNRTFRRALATKDPHQPKALENGGWPTQDGRGGYRPPNATGGGGGGSRSGSGGQSYVEPPTPWSHSMRQGDNGGGTTLAEQRAPYAAQFANNPALLERLKVLSIAEVGSSDQNAQAGLMESAMNRGSSHNVKDISSMLGANYYQPFTDGGYARALAQYRSDPELRARVDAAYQDAIGGSNHNNFATHNSSAGVAENARRTQTATTQLAKEQFSRKDNPAYAGLHGARTVQEEGDWYRRTNAAMARSRDPQADLKGVTKIVPGQEYPSGKGVVALNNVLRGGGGATGGALKGHTTEGVDPKLRHVVSEGVRQFEQDHPDLGVKVISGYRDGATDKGNHSGRGAEGGVQGGAAIDIQIYNKKTGQVYPNIGKGTPPAVIAMHQEINKNIYASGQHFYPNSGLRFGSFFSTGNEYDFMHTDLTKNQSNRGQYGGAAHGDMLRGFTPGAQRELGLTAEQNKAMHFGNPQSVKDLVEKMYPKDVTPPGGNTSTASETKPPGGDTATGTKPPTNDAASIKPPTMEETSQAPKVATAVKEQDRFQPPERNAFSYTSQPSNITLFGHSTIGDGIRPKSEAPGYIQKIMTSTGNDGRGAPAVSAEGKIFIDKEGIKKQGMSLESTIHHELGHHGAKMAHQLTDRWGGPSSRELFPELARHGADFEELRNRLADERDGKNRVSKDDGTHIGDWVHPQILTLADKLAAKDGITRDQMLARANAYEYHLNEKLSHHPDFTRAPYGWAKDGKPNPKPQAAELVENKPSATTGSKGDRGELKPAPAGVAYKVGGGPDATNVTKPIPTDDNPKIERPAEAPVDDGPKGKGDSSGDDEGSTEKPASSSGGGSGSNNDDNGGYGRVNTQGAGGSTDFGSSPGSDGYGGDKESPDNNGGICAI